MSVKLTTRQVGDVTVIDATGRITLGEGASTFRDAIRDLCAGFPAAYFREVDEKRGYPDAFVEALTKAGWLAASPTRYTADDDWTI